MTKEQREEQFRKMLGKATRGEIKQKDNVTSWGFMMDEKDVKKFLDFIESEVEKAKEEGKREEFEELLSLHAYHEYDDGEHTGFYTESLELNDDMIQEERRRLAS